MPPPRSLLRRLVAGAPWRLPRPLDALDDAWARVGARVRTLVRAVLVVSLAGAYGARLAAVDARWGGAPVAVLVAEEQLAAGEVPTAVRRARLPPDAVPPGAVAELPDGAVLALPVVAGSVLTDAHLDPRGPGGSLHGGERLLPVPVEPGWGVDAGGFVDVWVLGAGDAAGRLVAAGRPVLALEGDERRPVALVALDQASVAAAAEGLADGRLWLAHAPPASATDPA